jgi:ribosomal protein L11 methyltransferase
MLKSIGNNIMTTLLALASLMILQQQRLGFFGSCLQQPIASVRSPNGRKNIHLMVALDDANDADATSVASLRSVTICGIPKDQEPELLCDFLMEIGACSASLTDSDRGTDREEPLFGEPGTRSPWHDSLQWEAPIWNRCSVTAHFPSSVDLQYVITLISETFPDQYPLEEYSVDQVPNRDWVIHVQQSWKPIVVGPYVLRFPWHTQEDVQEATAELNDDTEERLELMLQGGVAFGTGEHPTTQLCLEWIHDQVKRMLSSTTHPTQISIMDYGTGSGVLGMAACALSPERVQAVGVDIDVDAIQIANVNAANNKLNMQSYLPPLLETVDDESKSLLLKAHAHARKQIEQQSVKSSAAELILPHDLSQPIYDIVVANILAGPLVALSPTIASLVKPRGRLAMSGILPRQSDMVIEAYSKDFDEISLQREVGGWVLITGVRKQH